MTEAMFIQCRQVNEKNSKNTKTVKKTVKHWKRKIREYTWRGSG